MSTYTVVGPKNITVMNCLCDYCCGFKIIYVMLWLLERFGGRYGDGFLTLVCSHSFRLLYC